MKNISPFGTLHWFDIGKGFAMAFLSAFLTAVLQILQTSKLPTGGELRAAGIVGITAGVVYIIKNLFTNSNGELLKKEETKS